MSLETRSSYRARIRDHPSAAARSEIKRQNFVGGCRSRCRPWPLQRPQLQRSDGHAAGDHCLDGFIGNFDSCTLAAARRVQRRVPAAVVSLHRAEHDHFRPQRPAVAPHRQRRASSAATAATDLDHCHWADSAAALLLQAISYEFFHQDRNSYTKDHPQYCWGNEGTHGGAWGHARSPDMLHWESMPVTGICASTGGGVTLPADFRGPNGERWAAAMLGSAPGGTDPRNTNGVGVGLKLWTSNDSDVAHFTEYLPPNTTVDPTFKDNNACVICPSKVRKGPSNPPSAGRSAFLGDSFTWSEPSWNIPSTNRTYYVLSGGGTCKPGVASEFCGFGGSKPGGAQVR